MRDFEKRFRESQKRGDLIRRFALGWIIVVKLIMLALTAGIIYLAVTSDPNEVARSLGELFREFQRGAEGEPYVS